MVATKLMRLAERVDADLERAYAGRPSRLREARRRVLRMVLTAAPEDARELASECAAARGLVTHAQALLHDLRARSRLPEALCAHYRYGRSCRQVLAYYGVPAADWQYAHRLARRGGADMEAAAQSIPVESLDWHDELERRIVSMRVILDPRALDDMLVCTLEAYLSPRQRKGYEVYGITLGMCRDVPETRRGTGRLITRYVAIGRAQPQLSAVAGPRHVEPNRRSLDALADAAATLFPQYQLMGDFHSHVYGDQAELHLNRGWEPSPWDEGTLWQWARDVRRQGHTPRVDFVLGIARCGRRGVRSHYRGMPHTLQATVGECRVVMGAYRILQSGAYTTEGVSLSVPGMVA